MAYKGTLTTAGSQTKYQFGSRIDPCNGAANCTNFPAADSSSAGGAMAIAIDSTKTNTTTCQTLPCIELWSIVPQANNVGSLYAYNVNSTPGLTHVWDSPTATACPTNPATSWFATAFTEPTLADNKQTKNTVTTTYGAVYVPTLCAVTDGTSHSSCGTAGTAAVSGVLVFTHCP